MSLSVALLRGVNVGGRARVPMDELRAVFAGAGCVDVVTYIQSGNVVFRPPRGTTTDALRTSLEQRIAATFGFPVAVLVRSAEQWEQIVSANPFAAAGADPKTLHVMVLAAEPPGIRVGELDPDRSPPDEFVVAGSEIYLRYPKGSGRSKLSVDYFERRLDTVATARNWNTVLRLVALLS